MAESGRRQFLGRFSAGIGAAAATLTTFGTGGLARAQSTSTAPGRPGRLPGLPASFSTAERDRRWSRVRQMMRKEGLDVLLTPAGGGEGDADSLYLAQQTGWVVFPADGRANLITDDESSAANGWIAGARSVADGRWSTAVVEALRDLKLDAGRVGVGRLSGALRNEEGEVPFATLDRVRQAFPRARFESAAEPLMRIKLVRSAEEVSVLEHAAAAGERAIAALVQSARPGMEHKDAWLAAFAAMVDATGQTPSRLAIRAGDEANTSTGGPMIETLQAGQIMNQEIGARALGYMAQVNHSICIGRSGPADWASAAGYCIDLFNELVAWVKPGKSFRDLCQLYVDRARARSNDISPTWVLIHTCGFGDGPRMGLTRTETPDLMIESGMVFTVKPRVVIKGAKPTAQFGDPILVTDTGARRLGKRKLEVISTT